MTSDLLRLRRSIVAMMQAAHPADVQSLAQGLPIARGRAEFPCTVQDEFCLRGNSGGTRTVGASNAIR